MQNIEQEDVKDYLNNKVYHEILPELRKMYSINRAGMFVDRQNKLNKSIDDMSLAITQILIDNDIIIV